MAEPTGELLDALAPLVAARMAELATRLVPASAVPLGRIGAPEDAHPDPLRAHRLGNRLRQADARRAAPPGASARRNRKGDASPAVAALAALDALVAERLLGAFEATIAGWDGAGVPDLSVHLTPPPSPGRFSTIEVSGDGRSTAVKAADMLARLRPDVDDFVLTLIRHLAAHPAISPRLTTPAPDGADEPAVAAAHGGAFVALGVATASVVVGSVALWPIVDRVPATVGAGIGAAATLLADVPMPPAYADALLARIRAEYLLPRQAWGSATVTGHRFALLEHEGPDTDDFSANGLVTVVDGGAVIRTGVAEGRVSVRLSILAEEPAEVEPGWEEVVEVSWRAAEGRASVVPGEANLRKQTPPWPGDYRLRVHAQGRDDGDETYLLVVWAAPPAPDVVHQRVDVLGQRLRGEADPSRPPRPELAYRWVHRSALSTAATVTVVTGSSADAVLRAFGADPSRTAPFAEVQYDGDWLGVLEDGDAVIAVEVNGYRGTDGALLARLSVPGRAASMFWNVNAVTCLSFAAAGEVLYSEEPWGRVEAGPLVAPAVEGLNFAADRVETGLLAVTRFTGGPLTEAALTAAEAHPLTV